METQDYLDRLQTALQLDDVRYEELHEMTAGWKEDTRSSNSTWERAIKQCYDTITESCLAMAMSAPPDIPKDKAISTPIYVSHKTLRKLDPMRFVYGLLVPLDAQGNNSSNLSLWIQSGSDDIMRE